MFRHFLHSRRLRGFAPRESSALNRDVVQASAAVIHGRAGNPPPQPASTQSTAPQQQLHESSNHACEPYPLGRLHSLARDMSRSGATKQAAAQKTLSDASSEHEIFDFFGLPRELRDEIYDLTLREPKHVKKSSLRIPQDWDELQFAHGPMLSLLLVNKQLNEEYQDAMRRAEPSQQLTLVINRDNDFSRDDKKVQCDEYLARKFARVSKLEVIIGWFNDYDYDWPDEEDEDMAYSTRQIIKRFRSYLVRPFLHGRALASITLKVRGEIEWCPEEEVECPMAASCLRKYGTILCGAKRSHDFYPMLVRGIEVTYCVEMDMPYLEAWHGPDYDSDDNTYPTNTYRAKPSSCGQYFRRADIEKLEPERFARFEGLC